MVAQGPRAKLQADIPFVAESFRQCVIGCQRPLHAPGITGTNVVHALQIAAGQSQQMMMLPLLQTLPSPAPFQPDMTGLPHMTGLPQGAPSPPIYPTPADQMPRDEGSCKHLEDCLYQGQ